MRTLLLVFSFFFCATIQAQLQLTVSQIPNNTPANDDIFVVGNFNNWDPGDAAYKLTKNGQGNFEITFTPPTGTVEYKFTRGSWPQVEGDANGNVRPNRTFAYNGQAVQETVQILSWENLGSSNSTAAPNVMLWNPAFNIPQLNRTRKIWVYLPPDYQTSTTHYKVLYMQDGQNLFDVATTFGGVEWEVDETLNTLFAQGDPGCIVVGIENGGSHRADEYHPWVHPTNPGWGGGEGDLYLDFIVNTLKPAIDANFRTLSDRLNTGIAGSSSGGVISYYASIKYANVFGRAGLFSPALFVNPQLYPFTSASTPLSPGSRFYFVTGLNESVSGVPFAPSQRQVVDTLIQAGYMSTQIQSILPADGIHAEWFWAREFPAAYQWLWKESVGIDNTFDPKEVNFSVYPNPASNWINLEIDNPQDVKTIDIFDPCGRVLTGFTRWQPRINVAGIFGPILIQVVLKNGARYHKPVVRL